MPRSRDSRDTTGHENLTARYQLPLDTGGPTFSWDDVDESLVRDCVRNVCLAGDAIMFGRSSDGGATLARVYSGGDAHSWYGVTTEGFEVILRAIRDRA